MDTLDKGTITLGELGILASIDANLGLSALRHGQVHIDLSLVGLGGLCANHPLKRLCGLNDARAHGKVGVDGDGLCDGRLGVLFLLRRGLGPALERAEDGDEALPLGLVVKGARVVARAQALFPGHGPDLQKVHRVRLVLIELAVRDSRAAGGELHVAAVHAVELVGLAALAALGEHGVAVRQLAGEDVAKDFKVTVRMRREARVGLDAVLVQDAQGAKV